MDKIAQLRRIVETGTCGDVQGCTVDLYTASAIIAVHDKLNPANQARYAGMDVPRMARIAFDLAGR